MTSRWRVAGAVALLAVGCSAQTASRQPARPGTAPEVGADAKLAREIDAVFGRFVAADTPGAAVVVVRDGGVAYQQAYGLADLEEETPLTTRSLFHLGSVGKQMTALAVMMLAEDGALELDDPIGRHLLELARLDEGVTIRRMLQHTSGFPDYYAGRLAERLAELADEPTNADALALLSEHGRLQHAPGAEFAYNNAAYDMLGSLVERLSGETYADFLRERIFVPAGMASTFSLPDAERRAGPLVAHSYVEEGGRVEPYDSDPLDNLVGSGSIYSSVEDMARYEAALQAGAFVSDESVAQSLKPARLKNGSRSPYGFGWHLGREDGRSVVSHDGAWLGFLAYYVRFPEEDLGVIVLVNRDYDLPDDDPALEVAELVLDAEG